MSKPTSTDRESLRSLIGGRWAVSWQGVALAWPFAVMFLFFSLPSVWAAPPLWQGVLKGIGLGTVAYGATGAMFWLASVTVLRNRRERPVAVTTVAIVGAVTWTARTLVINAYLEQQGLASSLSFPQRTALGMLQGAFAAVLAAWLLGTLDSFRTRRRLLVAQLVDEELANTRLTSSIEEMRARVLRSVRQTVQDSTRSLDTQLDATLPTARDVELLQDASRRVSKDLARELWQDAERDARLGPLTVLRSAVANRPFAYWAFLPTVIVAIALLSVIWPAAKAAALLLGLVGFSTAVSLMANALIPRLRPNSRLIAYAGAVLALLLGTPMVLERMMTLLGLTTPSGLAIDLLTSLNFGVLVPLLGIAAHLGRVQREVLDRLRRSIDVTEIQREALRVEEERLRRELAVALHGGLQAELTALTMRAQLAIDSGDLDSARRLIAQAQAMINTAVDIPHETASGLEQVVDDAVLAWAGLVDITARSSVGRLLPERTIKAIDDVLLEGIGNAVRHGRPRTILIEIDDAAAGVRIRLTDDGAGAKSRGRGLGSAVLDELAPGAWTLEAQASGGSVLTVLLSRQLG